MYKTSPLIEVFESLLFLDSSNKILTYAVTVERGPVVEQDHNCKEDIERARLKHSI